MKLELENDCYYKLQFTNIIIKVLDSKTGKAEYSHKGRVENSDLNWNDKFYNERLRKLSSLERELF